MVLEAQPLKQNIITLIISSENELEQKIQSCIEYLKESQSVSKGSFASICLNWNVREQVDNKRRTTTTTTNTTTPFFEIRMAIIGSSILEIQQKLKNKEGLIQSTSNLQAFKSQTQKLCFLFTGQGCHYPEMGQSLYKSCSIYRHHFDQCSNFLQQKYGLNLTRIPQDVFKRSSFLQTAYALVPTLVVQFSLFKMWTFWGIKPALILTHSLGEFSASIAAGLWNFEGASTFVVEECRHFELLRKDGKMLVVWGVSEIVEELVKDFKDVEVAALNSPTQIVLSGKAKRVEEFMEVCKENRLKCQLLPSMNPYHSTMMRPIYAHSLKVAKSISCSKKPSIPYISGLKGRLLKDGEMDGNYWCSHLVSKVRFTEGTKAALIEEGINFFLEIGPRPVLSAFVKSCNDSLNGKDIVCLPSLKPNVEDWTMVMDTLAKLWVSGLDVDWEHFYESI